MVGYSELFPHFKVEATTPDGQPVGTACWGDHDVLRIAPPYAEYVVLGPDESITLRLSFCLSGSADGEYLVRVSYDGSRGADVRFIGDTTGYLRFVGRVTSEPAAINVRDQLGASTHPDGFPTTSPTAP
jgi:hypothetical protein